MNFLPPFRNRLPAALLLLLLLVPANPVIAASADATGPDPVPALDDRQQQITDAEVRFQGNEALRERMLREEAAYELERFEQIGFRRADIDDAAFRMELAYREQGYPFAEVDYDYQVVESTAMVTFLISEGPRVVLEAILITGNQAFTDNQLRAFFAEERLGASYYVRSRMDDAVADIRDLYYLSGYLEARIEEPRAEFSPDRRRANIEITIHEGPPYLVSDLQFRGDIHPETSGELVEIRESLLGQPFNQQVALELRSRIREAYGNHGYAEIKVEVLQKQVEMPSQVLLEAIIDSGPRIRISEVVISGNQKTRESFIRNRLLLEPGDVFLVSDERQSFRRLYQTGLFSRVNLSLEEGPDEHHRILHVQVEELPSRELSVEAGWGSYELFRLRLGYLDRNPFGTGRTFRSELGGSYRGARLMASIVDPWFLRRDITAHLPIFINYRREPSFTRQEIGSTLLFTRELSSDLAVSIAYTFRNTSLTDIDVDVPEDTFQENYNLGSFKSQVSYITRNDIFFPTEGQESYLAGEIADTVLGSEITFYRVTAGTSHYRALGLSTVLAFRYDTGFTILTRGQDTLPPTERFFTGGESTVRSFRQDQVGPTDATGDPIGGLAFNVFSIELRQQLRGPLIGTVFVDYGNVAPNRESLFGTSSSELVSATFREYYRDLRPSIGLGLQYLLPIGPVRLDTAYNPEARDGERNYTIHFSVGMAF